MERKHLNRLGKRISLSVIFFLSYPANLVKAQVVPDGTLKSTVETIQELMKIDGGLRDGSNLFHSFEEFSIPEGMEASFENALEIENIFTRVTGDSASSINGTLSAQGGANLFLMNPNGIVFGQDASINIGGSFIATTADSIQFADETEFAATETEDFTPLLTNEIPIGLGFGSNSNSGTITVNGVGNQIESESLRTPTRIGTNSDGLKVNSGETLALVGDRVNLNGGIVTTEGGAIEIVGVEEGTVGINQDFQLDYSNIDSLGTVELEQQALISNTGKQSSDISITGADISIEDGSKVLLQNNADVSPGNLEVSASDSVVLEGTSDTGVGSGIQAQTTSAEKAGNINLDTQRLVLKDGSRVGSNTYGNGEGGDTRISATESVEIVGNSANIINASTYSLGDAGSINLTTNKLRITEGGGISSSTLDSGNGGNLNIEANSIELIGNLSEPNSLSAISAVSFSPQGNAGSVTVTTDTLEIVDGGAISTTSIGDGAAGNVTVDALKKIEISGQTESFPSAISSAVVTGGDLEFRAQIGVSENPSGSSGSVSVNTPSLEIVEGGEISVANEGVGSVGTLSINADDINLDESGSITAASASGNQAGGGNININATNITAKKNSDISASATGGDGGNITIDTETLLGLNNSDITANAVEGDGGNINITATSILGYQERPELTFFSDITASSEFGVDGTVTINSPETNAEEEIEIVAKKVEVLIVPLEFIKGCRLPGGILQTRGRGVPESPYPSPFGYLSHDEDVYKLAEETLRQERLKQQREEQKNGIREQEARERKQQRELAMLRERQRNLPNRHSHLMYEVTDDRDVGAMLLPAPKGKLVGDPSGRTDKNAIPVFLSQSNELPPISREKRLRSEGNVLVVNPDGSQHFVRMFITEHPTEQMCQSTVGSRGK